MGSREFLLRLSHKTMSTRSRAFPWWGDRRWKPTLVPTEPKLEIDMTALKPYVDPEDGKVKGHVLYSGNMYVRDYYPDARDTYLRLLELLK